MVNPPKPYKLAIERNATHGLQLSQQDKRDIARKIYTSTPLNEQGEKKKTLAKILSVRLQTIYNWLSRIDKDNKEKREAEIVKQWFACKTHEEIAEAVGMTPRGVGKILEQIPTFEFVLELGLHTDIEDEDERMEVIAEENRKAATHATDFTLPIYNVWKQQEKSNGSAGVVVTKQIS